VICGLNGTFPGQMINAEDGKPAMVPFTGRLDRQGFGVPGRGVDRAALSFSG
jgi:hypothetical protein